jgi:hypothetical protein
MMKKNTLRAALSIFLIVCLSATRLTAVPAYPHPITYQLPDNSTLTILLKGDEKVHWAQTVDGYSLLLNQEGYYEYAIKSATGAMVASGVRTRNIQDRNSEEILFTMRLQKSIRFNAEQVQAMRSLWEARDGAIERFLSTRGTRLAGSVKAPLILVGFQGKPFTSNASDFELLLNQPNYTANGTITGSVYDYFYDNSYGQLQFTVDVFGPYTMPESIASYNPRGVEIPKAWLLKRYKPLTQTGVISPTMILITTE